MSVAYLDLTDYLAIAAEVTGLDVTTLTKITPVVARRLRPSRPGGWLWRRRPVSELRGQGGSPVVWLTKNHPLPDGNKRAAWGVDADVRRDEQLDLAKAA